MPAADETGARAAGPGGPVQVVFVRLPADAPPQPGEPRPAARPRKAPVKGGPRRSPFRGRRKKQETTKMIKSFVVLLVLVAVYVACGVLAPVTGHTAIVFPTLAVVPAVGSWVCFLTYKGIAAMLTASFVGSKI